MILNGAFATPSVAYDLRAARLTFDTHDDRGPARGGKRAGQCRRHRRPGLGPRHPHPRLRRGGGRDDRQCRAERARSASPATRLVSDNMRLRSDRIDATLALAFDLSAGRYLAAINGRVNNYLVDSVGLFDLQTRFDMVNTAQGFGLTGRVAARSRRITNATDRRSARRADDRDRQCRGDAVRAGAGRECPRRRAFAARHFGRRHLCGERCARSAPRRE